MAEAVAVFDTNILPIGGDLTSPLWLSTLRLCAMLSITPCLPEIVVHESANLRGESYAAERTKFAGALKRISAYHDVPPIYIPDVDEIVTPWEASLRRAFRVVPIHGDDANAALVREARRRAPAKAGKGARDSAIWLTVLRLAGDGDQVYLVSANTKDFTSDHSPSLHPTLVAEAEGLDGAIAYFPNLDEFITTIAPESDPPALDARWLETVIGAELRDAALTAMAQETELQEPSADPATVAILVEDGARALRSYEIESRGLALVEGSGSLTLNPEVAETVPFRFQAWLDFDIASKLPLAGEVTTVTLSRPVTNAGEA